MTPIAIVGMGAVFPGAGTARGFWRNIRAGVDAITDVPPHRWDPQVYYDPDAYEGAPRSGRFYCRRGGFVDELATFDPTGFGIMPASVDGIEPDQLLALRTAAEAIADAGGEERLPDRFRVGVVIGRGGYLTPGLARFDQRVHTSRQLVAALEDLVPGLGADRLEEIRRAFCERLGPDRPDGSTGLVPSFAAARIANRFDLRGPAYTVDAACASALLAVEHAVRALRTGQCDAMLAGAVHHAHHVTVWSLFSQLRALSPSGRIRPFDRSADGTLLAEGTGMLLLKRLEDAQRDGDRVYAVIRGVGCASDGRAAGLMSPLIDGQVLAVERAWRDAGLDPREPGGLGLVEAHGTATPAGDGTELQTLRRVFGTGGPPVGLGTVKSMIGHAMPAGGVAGLIKAAFAVHDGVLPPTLHVEEPHPALEGTRFRPVREPAEWEAGPGVPRRAAVNAFGFGGANAHLVLEEAPASVRARLSRRPRRAGAEQAGGVLRLAAASPDELAALLAEPDPALVARTGTVTGEGPCRLAVAAPEPQRLALARTIVARGRPWRGRGDIWFTPRPLLAPGGGMTAFLFPGFEPVFRPRVDGVGERFGLPRPRLTGRGDLLGHAVDVIGVGRLLAAALRELGVEPDLVAGHSLGEWTAMIVAGMYPPDAADAFLAALDERPVHVPDVIYGALGCGAGRAAEAVDGVDGVTVSHDNCPHQSVICGPPGAVREVLQRLGAEGVLGQELPFRSGFHTPMAAGYLDAVRASFDVLPVERPTVPVWSATTTAPFPERPDEVRDLVVRHVLEPVRFSELIERLYTDAGVRAFVQVGPGGLTGFVDDRLGSREHLAIAANVPARDGLAQLHCVAAALWVDGYGTDGDTGGAPPAQTAAPGLRLDLGTPLIRLKDAVPPLIDTAAEQPPALPADTPVMAEFDALVRDTVTGARTVLEALDAGSGRDRAAEPTRSRVFSLETMPYVADHCLIAQRAGWPDSSDRFPVVPLTTLLEVMAETARELLPGQVVTGFENVRALRWVVAAPPTTTAVHARVTAPGRVEVRVGDYTDGVVLLADRYSSPPEPDRTPLTGEGPPAVTAERFYAERWMFHGPRYQGVQDIRTLAGDGLRAGVVALPAPGALMDAAGQLCGHWIQVYGDKDQTVFPVGIERVTWYGPQPPEGERLDVTVWNRTVSDTTVRCDAELVRADGTVWGRVDGWTTHRFYTDEAVWRMKFTPEVSGVGEPQPGGWCLARRHWDGASSRDLLMRHYLCAAERAEYDRLAGRAQGPWLLGRIAVKDAVRHWLWEQGHGPLFPAELTVHNDAAGRPEVRGPFDARLSVSIAHTADLAAALVRPAPQPAGIDVEAVRTDSAPIEGVALTETERALLERLAERPDTDRATAVTRLWTAKEAAAKAAGTGLQGRPQDFVVTAADGDRLLVVTGGEVTAVQTCLVDGHVVTWTVAPRPEDA
ncbi:Acyl transferase domain-containing protein [Thermomonospora echinospora]|uniref:Acyl transferase domain-containing protein n=1 Tax=Thermomonospora echinospora TaxID=1992 RepID=A0A1H5XMM7_9ACTN|nr:type I polyketide synthase [Thermomonospora echinospora]SEG13024.1 Acyl transferase domain-containing protein [Thermomonospora echinospora]